MAAPTSPFPDHTGWGPSTTGNNPSRYDYARNTSQRATMSRLMDQAANRDTYIQSLAPSAYRPFASEEERRSPAKLRQGVYSSEMGQATRDMLQAGRESGAVGHGSIGAMVHSLAQGSFSGIGVTTTENVREDLGKDANGKTKYGDYVRGDKGQLQTRQRGMTESVSGSGAITEKVASVMQDRMIKSLYGEGTADPEDFYGMAPDEAAGLVSGVMRRGGTKKMVNIKTGATGIERMDAAIDEQGNPMLKDQLQQVRQQMVDKGMSEKEQQAFLNQESKNSKLDPALQKELGSIGMSDTAVQVLDKGSRDVMNTVKSVAKGVSLLKDIYGDLASPEMAEALTGINGQGSLKMARRQASVLAQATNAASANGIDPKAMFDLMGQLAAKDAGRTNKAYNQEDAGDQPGSATVRASIATQSAIRGAEAAGTGKAAKGAAEELGYGNAEAFENDAASVATATQSAMNDVKEVYNGASLTKMLQATGSEEFTPEMQAQMAEFEATGSGKEGRAKRAMLSAQMLQSVKRSYGMEDMSDEQFAATGIAQDLVEKTAADPTAQNKFTDMAVSAKVKDQEWSSVRKGLAAAGATVTSDNDTTATDAAGQKLGKLGMLALHEASKLGTAEARKTQQEQIFKTSKMTEEEKASLMPMFKDDGTLVDEKKFMGAAERVGISQKRMGDTGEYAKEMEASRINAQQKAAEQGDYFKNEKGGYDINSLVKNMGLGKQKGFSSPQETAHALETLKAAGITDEKGKGALKELGEQYVTDVDVSKGVNKKTLSQMNKMMGFKDGDGQLSKTLGFESDEAMMNETKTQVGLQKFLTQTGEKTGITMSGDPSKMTMTSPDLVDKAQDSGLMGRLKKVALLEKIDPTRKNADGTMAGLSVDKIDVLNGKDFNLGVKADEKAKQEGTEKGADGKKVRNYRMQNQGKLAQMAEGIKGMSEAELAEFRKMDEGGQTVGALKGQAETLRKQIEKDPTSQIVTKDPSTGEEKKESATDALAKLTAAIAKLEGAQGATAAAGKEMVVTTLKVDKMEVTNPPKK